MVMVPIGASVEEKIRDWINDELNNPNSKFRNKSHLVETALEEFKEKIEKKRKVKKCKD